MIWRGTPPVTRAFLGLAVAICGVRLLLIRQYCLIIAVAAAVPLHDHFFPALLRQPALLAAAFFAPLWTEVQVLLRPTAGRMKRHAVAVTLSAAVLLVHQASYFFATWIVVFWAGLFLAWLAWSGTADPEGAGRKGPFLAQLLTAFWFLGGAAGKWTAGYWAGEPFHDLFFAHHPYAVYALLRTWLDPDTLRVVATWFSRGVVVVETAMAGVAFVPARVASTVSIAAALGMWLSTGDLYDVAGPVIGTALAARILAAAARPEIAGRRER